MYSEMKPPHPISISLAKMDFYSESFFQIAAASWIKVSGGYVPETYQVNL